MEIVETPCIQNTDRRAVFPLIKWLSKQKFEEYLKYSHQFQIYPYIDSNEGVNVLSSRIYIGKTIPNSLDEGIEFGYDHRLNKKINLEIIGTVSKNLRNEWTLNIPHGGNVHEIKNNFLVLCLNDSESYKWIETELDLIPKYSLRGAIDQLTREYFYIGLNALNGDFVKGQHFENGSWKEYDHLGPAFGKVHISHKCLYAPINELEMQFTKYRILALKPSPCSLKNLCRISIRILMSNSNENIKKINNNKSGRLYLPVALINYLKYPSYLSVGEYLIKGEKIVREDDNFELLIEDNNNLVIKSIIHDVSEQDTQIKRIISSNVHSIWLQRFQIVIYKNDWSVFILHNFLETSPNYKLRIDNNLKPNIFVDFNEQIHNQNSF